MNLEKTCDYLNSNDPKKITLEVRERYRSFNEPNIQIMDVETGEDLGRIFPLEEDETYEWRKDGWGTIPFTLPQLEALILNVEHQDKLRIFIGQPYEKNWHWLF